VGSARKGAEAIRLCRRLGLGETICSRKSCLQNLLAVVQSELR